MQIASDKKNHESTNNYLKGRHGIYSIWLTLTKIKVEIKINIYIKNIYGISQFLWVCLQKFATTDRSNWRKKLQIQIENESYECRVVMSYKGREGTSGAAAIRELIYLPQVDCFMKWIFHLTKAADWSIFNTAILVALSELVYVAKSTVEVWRLDYRIMILVRVG